MVFILKCILNEIYCAISRLKYLLVYMEYVSSTFWSYMEPHWQVFSFRLKFWKQTSEVCILSMKFFPNTQLFSFTWFYMYIRVKYTVRLQLFFVNIITDSSNINTSCGHVVEIKVKKLFQSIQLLNLFQESPPSTDQH